MVRNQPRFTSLSLVPKIGSFAGNTFSANTPVTPPAKHRIKYNIFRETSTPASCSIVSLMQPFLFFSQLSLLHAFKVLRYVGMTFSGLPQCSEKMHENMRDTVAAKGDEYTGFARGKSAPSMSLQVSVVSIAAVNRSCLMYS